MTIVFYDIRYADTNELVFVALNKEYAEEIVKGNPQLYMCVSQVNDADDLWED